MSQDPTTGGKPRPIGVNHVALEVGELDAALGFSNANFAFTEAVDPAGMGVASRKGAEALADLGAKGMAP